MRHFHKNIPILVVALLAISLYACKKDNYLTDGGVHIATTPYSTYDYMAGNSFRIFDTVLTIIDHYGLKDSINKAGTFFAPTDYSVNRLMILMHADNLDALYTMISSRFITQYLFSDTAITLENAGTAAKIYNNWADTIAGVKKQAYTYGVVSSNLTYYVLQYVKINGYLDGAAGAPNDDPTDAILNCQTTGIITSTATRLHVLSNASSLAVK